MQQVEENYKDSFIQGMRDCIPTLLGYLSIGFSFGIVGSVSGLSVIEIGLISLLIYAGSAQFILCALLLASTPATAIIFTIFVVNLRHFLMSLTVAPYLTRYSLMRNIGFGSLLTDETFGVAVTEAMKNKTLYGRWMDGLNITAYLCWIAACVIGAYFGRWIPDAEQWGLDFALIAMFIALLVLQLASLEKKKLYHYLKLIALMFVTMYTLLHFFSVHVSVLIAALFVAVIGVLTEK